MEGKKGSFSLQKKFIDITQNVAGTNNVNFYFYQVLIVFEQYVCNIATLLMCSTKEERFVNRFLLSKRMKIIEVTKEKRLNIQAFFFFADQEKRTPCVETTSSFFTLVSVGFSWNLA